MVQRAGIISLICVMFCVVIGSIEAGNWTEWRDITLCDAMPCGCPGETVKDDCIKGTKYQLRGCVVGSDGRACQYDGDGPIRKIKTCENKGKDFCPGWSKYVNTSECELKQGKEGTMIQTRYCNDPPPTHKEIKCVNSDGGEDLEEEKYNIPCNYVAPTTTTTTAAPTTTKEDLPCCEPGTTASGPTTTSDPDTSEEYFDYGSLFCDHDKVCDGEEPNNEYNGDYGDYNE